MSDPEALTRTERKDLIERRPQLVTSDQRIEVPEVERGLLRRAGAAAAFSLDQMEQPRQHRGILNQEPTPIW